MIDVFAWIVLFILVVSAVAMFFIAGSLPGYIAKSRNHPADIDHLTVPIHRRGFMVSLERCCGDL